MSGRTETQRKRLKRVAMIGIAAIGVAQGPALGASPAVAQDVSAERAIAFDIPAGSVRDALRGYADATGFQLVYNAALDTAGASGGVSGTMTAREALSRLLAGTGLSYRFVNATTVTIENAVTADGERVLGAVRVEGAQYGAYGRAGQAAGVNGVNGSRDITATEGTGSYTSGALTIGSKSPQALKDVPQSLSVITQQRLQDQNITDFTAALNQAPGVTLVQSGSSLQSSFYSRGFEIRSIQIDGGAPLNTGFNYLPLIDLSQYDHVEVLRGAAGLFNGYGDPSGTINLVRKKPLDHAQVLLDLQYGSWNSYRGVLDLTSPLAFDGKLRGRLVATYQDNEHFYQIAKDNKVALYGVIEYELTPTTLVAVGASHNRQDSVPWLSGLPRFSNGDDLRLPRAFCLCFPWNKWDVKTNELFGQIEQQIGKDWTVKLNVTRNVQTSEQLLGANFGGGTVNPVTLTGPFMVANKSDYSSEQIAADATISGSFEIFGQKQEIVVGANYSKNDGGKNINYSSQSTSSPIIDVFDFDPYDADYAQPTFGIPASGFPKFEQSQTGIYANFKFTAFENIHLITGLRYSKYSTKSKLEGYCTFILPGFCDNFGDVSFTSETYFKDEDFTWPPAVSLVYDVAHNISAYAGYTDIYISQANNLGENLQPLDPVTGSNLELGLKYQSPNGRLNASAAVYRIEQKGAAVFVGYGDYESTGGLLPDGQRRCCYVGGKENYNLSEGVDLEVIGEVASGLQVSLGYTYNNNRVHNPSIEEVQPLVSRQPKHLLKFWGSYRFSSDQWYDGMTIGVGINAQTKAFQAGVICVEFDDATQECVSEIPYDYTQKSYAVVSAMLSQNLGKNWIASLNFNNLTDVRYYQTMGDSAGGNWYGEPRSVSVSLRGKW